ncbi:MAG TPA: peptidylprolyl isomerase [Bdellovibrionales bacterium]|nr:MAG: hypothetical protein A2Z97_10565 [Bdellovibrionales bacterium GWB1_52_6]OFZ02525.1 MAG: hypothetical protein A2X97_07640 [Bdellovibrionales bacterium GWA1_52_35]OFZ36611.1 MAG: hypothetical protein A2070_00070 [Bdellovibrionales bacterium GWC1_52_8]HAR43372.1 peptidylprolyl isomerase [Bdellovibrionales bacterium]HCM41371.1 peptidylprolyl isomerase [Bdellovibrionales bacterium]
MRAAGVLTVLALIFGTTSAWSADLAKVNGKAITDKDLDTALAGIPDAQRETILKDANSKRQIINGLVEQELLAQAAEKEKLDQTPDFKSALEGFRKQYLANRLLQKNLGPEVNEKAVKKFYEKNKNRYSTDMVHAQHILVATEEQAREMLKKAKAPGADFQELAEKNSKDPSAKNNRGDLGFFGRDRMVPEFTEPAFKASEGEIIGPVKTGYGYHVIKIIKKKFGKVMDFADVELKAQNDLRQELAQSFVGKLRKDAKVEFIDKAIDAK